MNLIGRNRIYAIPVNSLWNVCRDNKIVKKRNDDIEIFGRIIQIDKIQWNRDYVSGFEFPKERFDRIHIKKIFNKGIDIKFPWELSRCYFFVAWGQNFRNTQNFEYYQLFRKTLRSWIKENPFLVGVNWQCTMEVAIRASNWIIACELFREEINGDTEFEKEIAGSLQQHALYVDWFTEDLKNNHDISNYAGLLFLSLSLGRHPRSGYWKKKALAGLEKTMMEQVFDDGVSYEYSTSYHRLVLEFFAISAIVCRANGIPLSNEYYGELFRMFEFSAAYINAAGMEPQINDNDSGRFIVFSETREGDHSYLLSLGEHIYDHSFISQCTIRRSDIRLWLPGIKRRQIKTNETRNTAESIAFEKSGFYFLKNRFCNLMVNCNDINKDAMLLHKHFDLGSFTLSYKDRMIIIDPGTYTYTRSLKKRNYFRSIGSHNTVIFSDPQMEQFSQSRSFFGSKLTFPDVHVTAFKPDCIKFQLIYHSRVIDRSIELDENRIVIKDSGGGRLTSYLHVNSRLRKIGSEFAATGVSIKSDCESAKLRKSPCSASYGVLSHSTTCLVQKGPGTIATQIYLSF